VALFQKGKKGKENIMGFQKQPQKKNQTSFSKTFQPSAGSRANKKPPVTRKMKQTVAKAALAKMGFNPMETQISLVLMYQDMLSRGVGWDKVSPITARETESFFNSIAKINADLMQYQTPKHRTTLWMRSLKITMTLKKKTKAGL